MPPLCQFGDKTQINRFFSLLSPQSPITLQHNHNDSVNWPKKKKICKWRECNQQMWTINEWEEWTNSRKKTTQTKQILLTHSMGFVTRKYERMIKKKKKKKCKYWHQANIWWKRIRLWRLCHRYSVDFTPYWLISWCVCVCVLWNIFFYFFLPSYIITIEDICLSLHKQAERGRNRKKKREK